MGRAVLVFPPRAPTTTPVGACCPRVPSPALPPPVPLIGGAPPVPAQTTAGVCALAHMGPRSPLRHFGMPHPRFWPCGHCPPHFVHSCATIASCHLALSCSGGSVSGALGLHRPTAPVTLAGYIFLSCLVPRVPWPR